LATNQAQQRFWRQGTTLVKAGPTPAFVLARVFAAVGAGVSAYVREQQG
jgi:hypothetical protein